MTGRVSRRRFLAALGSGFGSIILVACRPANPSAIPTVYVRRTDGTPEISPTPAPTPAAARPTPVARLAVPSEVPITSQADLYITSFRGTPEFDHNTWSLVIDGEDDLVRRPLRLTMTDILARPAEDSMRGLQCISNPVGGGLIGNVVWRGTSLAPILEEAGVSPAAAYAWFEAADGYTTSVTMRTLSQPGTLLVYEANGEPLEAEHGAPLRLMISGLYGQKMPKWITRIHFAREDRLGYWEQEHRGWSNTAVVRTNSGLRGLVQQVPFTDPIRVQGYAFAGDRGISRVEVRPGENALWHDAVIIQPPEHRAWTWWIYDWTPPAPGRYRLAVRATDGRGYTQVRQATGMFGSAFPDGTEAIHETTVNVATE